MPLALVIAAALLREAEPDVTAKPTPTAWAGVPFELLT
jgi:hypothetical protein